MSSNEKTINSQNSVEQFAEALLRAVNGSEKSTNLFYRQGSEHIETVETGPSGEDTDMRIRGPARIAQAGSIQGIEIDVGGTLTYHQQKRQGPITKRRSFSPAHDLLVYTGGRTVQEKPYFATLTRGQRFPFNLITKPQTLQKYGASYQEIQDLEKQGWRIETVGQCDTDSRK